MLTPIIFEYHLPVEPPSDGTIVFLRGSYTLLNGDEEISIARGNIFKYCETSMSYIKLHPISVAEIEVPIGICEAIRPFFIALDADAGQHHLELDESALQSTGKSVSIDDVLASIDYALNSDI